MGIVLSIDLLSVKISTFANLFIRIPNEQIIKTDYLSLKNSIMQGIKERFDCEDIEIPFPHISVYTGSKTTPFPVELIEASFNKGEQISSAIIANTQNKEG